MRKQRVTVVLALIMFFAIIALTKERLVYSATDSLSIFEINYEAETLTIQAAKGDTKIFFASSLTASTWDEVYGTIDSSNRITMDISWASKSSNVSFYIKGDVSSTPIKVTLPKQPVNFKASLNMASNTINFSNLGSITTVYWRKSTSDIWYPLNTNNVDTMNAFMNELEGFSLQGIKLYFRTAQSIGSADNQGSRPSKETLLSISKRAAAPTTIKVDYSKLSLTVKNTMEYKKSTSDVWIPITGSSLSFSEAASELLYGSSQDVESVSLDFRIKATSSKTASISKTLVLNAQENTEISNIKIQYTGATQLKLSIENEKDSEGEITIHGASSTNPYEYTIVKPDTVFNIEKAVWTSITTTNAVTITSTNAPEGSVIYIRKKATSEKPAAAYQTITVNEYPTAASLKEKVKLYKISGLNNKNSIFTVLVPFEDTSISSITFEGKTAKFKASSATKNEDGEGYLITVTITDITAVENVSSNIDKELEGKITLNNGDLIQSGVTLYIYPATSISGDNMIIYKDIKCEEDIELSVSLGHETKKNNENNEVTSIMINEKTIPFEQKYDTENEYTKIVTIDKTDLDVFADSLTSAQLGNAYKFVVELNNGEIITSNVTVTTKLIASVSSTTTGIGISVSSYLENKAEIEKAKEDAKNSENGSTTTVAPLFENPVLTITIDPALYAKDNSYIVSSVNWENMSIVSSYVMNKNVITITLDISKVVAIDMTSVTSYSSPVSIMIKSVETNHEVAITSAYKITVVK